jgi:hypothetical protein
VTLCRALDERTPVFGRLRARDLWLIVGSAQAGEVTSEKEIQDLLDTLASPLIRALDGDAENGYRPSSSWSTVQARITLTAGALGAIGDES